jgi:hypothetical protein
MLGSFLSTVAIHQADEELAKSQKRNIFILAYCSRQFRKQFPEILAKRKEKCRVL